jgi:methionine S-methyltransferase
MNSIENLLETPTSVKMAIFESFARQNITDAEIDLIPEIYKFINTKLGIRADPSLQIILSDSSRSVFSKLVLQCRDVGGTLLFVAGSDEAYIYSAKLLGASVKLIQTEAADSFKLTEKLAAEAFTSAEKPFLYFTGPTIYPTGMVYSKTEIEALIACASKHGAHLFVDTSFSGLEFDLQQETWNLRDVDCSNVTVIGNFSSQLLSGALELCFALVRNSFLDGSKDHLNFAKPHGTHRYAMKKLLKLYNEKDANYHRELTKQRNMLLERAESFCKVGSSKLAAYDPYSFISVYFSYFINGYYDALIVRPYDACNCFDLHKNH